MSSIELSWTAKKIIIPFLSYFSAKLPILESCAPMLLCSVIWAPAPSQLWESKKAQTDSILGSCCVRQSGDRRYLYHQGNEQTTWRRSEGGRQALVNTCGEIHPCGPPAEEYPSSEGYSSAAGPWGGGTIWGVAVLFGWSVSHGGSSGGLCGLYRGQIYGSSSCDFSQSQFFVTYIHTDRKIKPTHLKWWHLRLHKKRDQQKIQPGPDGVIHCDQCDYKARRRVYFNRHYNIEHGKIRFTCNQCEFESKNKSALKQHTLRFHENIKYLCEVCKKTYPTKGSLRMHTNSMHEEAEWKKCDHCDYKAKTYHVLDTHVGSKHNGVTFICDQCDFSAKWSSHLNKHKRTKHDGVRFKCDLCDNDYSFLADVSKHKRMKHDGVRFDCNQCDVKLSIQYSLQNHINSKHTDKWIECEQCHIQQHFKRP